MLWLLVVSMAGAMTLQEAVDGALDTSPTLDVAAAQVAQAEARVREADAALLPTATLSGGAVLQNEIEFSIADQLPEQLFTLIDPEDITPMEVQPGFQLQANATVTQPLVVPAVWSARKASREGLSMTRAEADAQRTQVIGLAVEAWHASAQAHALVDDARRGVELAEHLVDKGEAMVEYGVAAPDQILPFRQALASARSTLALVEEAARTADGVLEQVTGQPGPADPPVVPEEVPDLDALLANLDRPDLRAAESRVRAAEASLALTRSTRLPIVAATASATLLEPEPAFGDQLNYRLMLGAQVPLFQGGAVSARVSGSAATVDLARAGSRALHEAAEVQVRAAHGGLATSMASLSELEEAVRLSREAVEAAEERMAEGGGSLLALQQAQASQIAAEARLTRGRAAAARASDALTLAVRGEL